MVARCRQRNTRYKKVQHALKKEGTAHHSNFLRRNTHIVMMLRFLFSLAAYEATGRTACKSIPGDASWPSTADWSRFNATINGRLSATIPLGHVCHDPTYNKTQCAELMDGIVKNGAKILYVVRVGRTFKQTANCDLKRAAAWRSDEPLRREFDVFSVHFGFTTLHARQSSGLRG